MLSFKPIVNLWDCGHTTVSMLTQIVFYTRLAQAMEWCDSRANPSSPGTCLRSAQLAPELLPVNRDAAVCSVGIRRRPSYSPHAIDRCPPLNGARLLVFFPNANLADGAASNETNGYFDGCNIPPWDTWVSYYKNPVENGDDSYNEYLIAYVPSVFTALVQSGINVNPEQCIAWIEDTGVPLLRQWS